ncbi:glutathione s-transferase [Plakobranchus ocellatus]|uniref:Glutathione s-transferase n=1 Tax=Plakobranchus ocellatus TaxID=259542 RepID=A0AAV3XUZ0_9GAST|nr:glutathione s-transferase [Plakobranchus ocellatus]
MPNYKVIYFNVRGRAEVTRLIFAYAGQKFEDKRIVREEWLKLKPSTPFGQVPVLQIDDKMYAQSAAIANYLAREFGLYGKTNMDAFEIDQVVCLIEDFFNAHLKVKREEDETKKAELLKKYLEEEVPKYLGFLEGLLKKNGSGYFVGSDTTLADISVYDFVFGLNENHPKVLETFPLVKGHMDKIASLPNIKAYLDVRPPTPF